MFDLVILNSRSVIQALSYALATSRNEAEVQQLLLNPDMIAYSIISRLSVIVHPYMNPFWTFGVVSM